MGTVTGTATMAMRFQQVVSSGFVTPQTLNGFLNQLGSGTENAIYGSGTGAGQCDLLHVKAYTLAASATTIDLTSLLDMAGGAINFARVREFVVYNPDAVAGHDVLVEQGASNGWAFAPVTTAWAGGGAIRQADPLSTGGGNGAIVGGSSKTVKFDPSSHTVTIWVLIAGSSVL